MKTRRYILAFAAALLAATGCLREDIPTTVATEQMLAESDEALQGMLNGTPAQMVTPYFSRNGTRNSNDYDFSYPGLMIMFDTLAGELVLNGKDNYDWFMYWIRNVYSIGEGSDIASVPWVTLYKYIRTCNNLVSIIGYKPDRDASQTILGQALAYRAFCYLNLARMYEFKPVTDPSVSASYRSDKDLSGQTVPIVVEEMGVDQARNNPRASVEEIYAQIFSDLDKAEEMLADKGKGNGVFPDIAVVYGLKARAWLERGSAGVSGAFDNAAEYALRALTAFGGSPLTQDQWESPTAGFNNYTANSNSWMWYVPVDVDHVHNLGSFVSHMSNEETWTSYGWSSARGINKTVYNRIPDTDWRKHSWIDPLYNRYYAYKVNRAIDGEQNSTEKGLPPYANLKFRPAGGDCAGYKEGGAVDVPLMRMEEMYLIRAEALAMAGDLAGGKQALVSLVSTRNPQYSCDDIATAADFQKEVFFQKRVELWGEGLIFFDCKRLGTGFRLGFSGTNALAKYRYNVEGVSPTWNFVIPRAEIQGNPVLQGYNNPDPSNTLTIWTE